MTPALRFDDGGTRPWVLGWVARVARDAYRGDHTCDTTTTDRSTTRPTRRTTSRPSFGVRRAAGRLVTTAIPATRAAGMPAPPVRCRRFGPGSPAVAGGPRHALARPPVASTARARTASSVPTPPTPVNSTRSNAHAPTATPRWVSWR